MTGSWNHGLWISLGRMSALELPNNVNRFWSLLSWCFFCHKNIETWMVSNRQVGSFFFQVFFWVNNSRHFSVEKETPYGWFHWRRVFVFLSIKPFFFRSAQFRKKTPNKNTTQPPSFPASSWWVALRRLFNLKKVRSLSDANPQTLHYYRETPSKSPYILHEVWYPPPKWGNLMTPAETPQKWDMHDKILVFWVGFQYGFWSHLRLVPKMICFRRFKRKRSTGKSREKPQ